MDRDLKNYKKSSVAKEDVGKNVTSIGDRWFTREEAHEVRKYAKRKMSPSAFHATDSIVSRFGLNF